MIEIKVPRGRWDPESECEGVGDCSPRFTAQGDESDGDGTRCYCSEAPCRYVSDTLRPFIRFCLEFHQFSPASFVWNSLKSFHFLSASR